MCRGTAKLVRGTLKSNHNHSAHCFPKNYVDAIIRFKKELKAALETGIWRQLRDVFDEVATKEE